MSRQRKPKESERVSKQVTHRALSHRVLLLQRKAGVGVVLKVLADKGAALEHLLWEGSLDVHHQLEHLVVGAARKKDLACEELVDDTAHTPHVHRVICNNTKSALLDNWALEFPQYIFYFLAADYSSVCHLSNLYDLLRA